MAEEQPILAAVPASPSPAQAASVATEAPVASPASAAAPIAPAVEKTAPVQPATETQPAAAPAADTTKVAETAPKAETKTEEQKPAASLLSEAGKEPPAPADAAPAEKEAQAEAAPLPKYDALTLPEGVKLDDDSVGKFDSLLGKYEQTAKADHASFTQLRQELVNMYVAEKQREAQFQREVWQRTRKEWRDQVSKDRTIGGNRLQTVLTDAAVVRDRFATPRFREMIELTGAGDHPGMIEFVNNVARYLDRHGLLREGKPVPATKAVQPPPSKKERRYSGTSMNGAA